MVRRSIQEKYENRKKIHENQTRRNDEDSVSLLLQNNETVCI